MNGSEGDVKAEVAETIVRYGDMFEAGEPGSEFWKRRQSTVIAKKRNLLAVTVFFYAEKTTDYLRKFEGVIICENLKEGIDNQYYA